MLEVGELQRHILFFDTAHAPHATETPHSGLGEQLARCGYDVDTTHDAAAAGERMAHCGFDLAVVHADTTARPDVTIAAVATLPVAVILDKPEQEAIVRWLEAGADTVLAASVSRRELAARLEALARSSASYETLGGRLRPAFAGRPALATGR